MATFAKRVRYDPRRRSTWQQEQFIGESTVRMSVRRWGDENSVRKRPAKPTPAVKLDVKRLSHIIDCLAICDTNSKGSCLSQSVPNNVMNVKRDVAYDENLEHEKSTAIAVPPRARPAHGNMTPKLVCHGLNSSSPTHATKSNISSKGNIENLTSVELPPSTEDVVSKQNEFACKENRTAGQTSIERAFSSLQAKISRNRRAPVRRNDSRIPGNNDAVVKLIEEVRRPVQVVCSPSAIINETVDESRPKKIVSLDTGSAGKENLDDNQPFETRVHKDRGELSGKTVGIDKKGRNLRDIKTKGTLGDKLSLNVLPSPLELKLVVDGEKRSQKSEGVNHWKFVSDESRRVLRTQSPNRATSTLRAMETLESMTVSLSMVKQFILTCPTAHPIVEAKMKRNGQQALVADCPSKCGDKRSRTSPKLPPLPSGFIRQWDRKPKQASKIEIRANQKQSLRSDAVDAPLKHRI